MWMQVVYLMEVFATLACIHGIYGKKIQWDVKPIALCLSLMVIYGVANSLQYGGVYSLVAYIPVFIYCKRTFGMSMLQTLVKIIWMIILMAVVEFIGVLLVINFAAENLILRNILAALFLLIVSIVIFPKVHIDRVDLKNKEMKMFFGIVFGIVLFIMFQGKIMHNINLTLFVLAIPILIILLYCLAKWSSSYAEVDRLKKEFSIANFMEEKYTELLSDIRIKQHGFKNHITAILSAHYACKTYEGLVEIQDEYCNKLMQENRYNDLVQLGNKVLVGFLYDKFCNMEDDNITVRYKINADIVECGISTYYLIEMLGILLDNAVEAVKYDDNKTIVFVVDISDNNYLFSVRNKSENIPYSEITSWFQEGVSSKGKNRGLGLYHVKKMCQELSCSICCRNVEYEQENWIEFCLEIDKADRR